MGSLIVTLDDETLAKVNNRHIYSDVDMLNFKRPDSKNVPMAYDVEAVRISIRNILMWRVGENVIRPEFGHKLNQSMYAQATGFNREKVCQEVKRAIEENEPRVDVNSVGVEPGGDGNNALKVKVVYTVKGNIQEQPQMVEYSMISRK